MLWNPGPDYSGGIVIVYKNLNPWPDYSGVPDGTTGKLKAQCGCPVGKKLASDEKTCVVDPDPEPVDPSYAPWDFTCANGRCIQKTWKHVGSQVSGVDQSSGSVKISTTASILPKVVSVYVKPGRNCEATVTPSVKTLMNVHHLVFVPRSGKGFYRCSCSEGYTLDTDKKTCKAANHSLAYLVISNHCSILTADLNQRSLERVPVLVENVVATTSDMKSAGWKWIRSG
ncbi:hypothetical protein Pmani_003713 [Petrolisthes manimaculis]|uniref:Complement Clr-like EGF domain-containing protein n=1 Tax=Petrolisthes manimaculis TaxID=1843537 RepID=A0AAE1QFJ2_9EUCA|nr:hypothetical protein Pmani_003713 [Petrolisthes manimaculis]